MLLLFGSIFDGDTSVLPLLSSTESFLGLAGDDCLRMASAVGDFPPSNSSLAIVAVFVGLKVDGVECFFPMVQ